MEDAGDEVIEEVALESQQREQELFLDNIRRFYETEFEDHAALFDYVADQTNNFRELGPAVIRDEPNVVKVLRYLVKPPISQMKFGQFAGITSTDSYEGENPSTPRRETASQIASFVEQNLDWRKVPWLSDDEIDEEKAVARTREWVCDIIAQSEAKTRYRNWRKDVQEEAIEDVVVEAGLDYVDCSGVFQSVSDIPRGAYTTETKVDVGSTNQKADFILRRGSGEIVFIEAKAVGVRIDAYKRIKEIRNKASDWRSAFPDSTAGAAIAGWVPASQVESLHEDGIEVFWEHRLGGLERAVRGE